MSEESPPLLPRAFFGREELIGRIVNLAENFVSIALTGAGGIGKTSAALTVLHHDRIKRRFGRDRQFIRCDQFPPSCAHLLRRLSEVIGTGIENPEDLTPLRTFLSSKEMLIVFDNAESILDPRGTDAHKIYTVMEELSRFDNICVCITSRISTTPPGYKRFDVPTLSMDAACDTFYGIYDSDDRPDVINGILKQLDFHPLSITLLATVARQNKWNTSRLVREWEERKTSVLQTRHHQSLAAAIELSLASPLFQDLGPEARAILGVVAFFPQGVDENNLDWLFSTISDRINIFDKFCILSLTYRSNGFVTMLAPLRDYLRPKDPKSSSLLCTVKERYLTRMSIEIDPDKPTFEESRWIVSEDVNVEHLLDVFTTIDANSEDIWDACANFINHLCWHKNRHIILGPKIEGLLDDHSFKPGCLNELSRLFASVGNFAESKRLCAHTLKIWREWGDDRRIAHALNCLSNANRLMGLREEGMEQAKEAVAIFERLGDTLDQAQSLITLAHLLHADKQLDAAEDVAYHAISLIPEKGEEYRLCDSHLLLGGIYQSKRDAKKAIYHNEVALGIASASSWHDSLFWINHNLAALFCDDGRFDEAHAHIELAKSHTANSAYTLGRAMELWATVWYKQRRVEEAKAGALRAADVYEKLGNAQDVERCRKLLERIEGGLDTPGWSRSGCEFLQTIPPLPHINLPIYYGFQMIWRCCRSLVSPYSFFLIVLVRVSCARAAGPYYT